MIRVLLVGHSHLACIQRAFEQRAGQVEGLQIEFAPVSGAYFQPNLDPSGIVHPALERLVKAPRFNAVVSVIGGNAHFSLGLVNNLRSYDFVLPDAPDLPLEQGA